MSKVLTTDTYMCIPTTAISCSRDMYMCVGQEIWQSIFISMRLIYLETPNLHDLKNIYILEDWCFSGYGLEYALKALPSSILGCMYAYSRQCTHNLLIDNVMLVASQLAPVKANIPTIGTSKDISIGRLVQPEDIISSFLIPSSTSFWK